MRRKVEEKIAKCHSVRKANPQAYQYFLGYEDALQDIHDNVLKGK
jgi:hypothetical protein